MYVPKTSSTAFHTAAGTRVTRCHLYTVLRVSYRTIAANDWLIPSTSNIPSSKHTHTHAVFQWHFHRHAVARHCINGYCLSQWRHWRTSQGCWRGGGLQPQIRANPLFFGQKLNFLGISQQAKMKKKIGIY